MNSPVFEKGYPSYEAVNQHMEKREMFSTKCKEHLNDANMTRTGHMIHALTMAIRLQCLVPILIIHSIIPSLFKMTATKTMSDLVGDKEVNELDEHWDSTRQHIDQPNKWYNTK